MSYPFHRINFDDDDKQTIDFLPVLAGKLFNED
jgi:hypothetical protein